MTIGYFDNPSRPGPTWRRTAAKLTFRISIPVYVGGVALTGSSLALPAAVLLAAVGTFGCGEAVVRYKGTVAAGQTTRYSFDDVANPVGDAPIEGAKISFYISGVDPEPVSGCTQAEKVAAQTNENGEFDTKDISFVGPGERTIQLCVRANGFETLEYRTTSANFDDPVNGEKNMNVTLKAL